MKINRKEYPMDARPVLASEERVVYDDPMPELEEVWNGLAGYYGKKMADAMEYVSTRTEFQHAIAGCRVANETALTMLDLIRQGVLKPYPTSEAPEEKISIKPYILGELRQILDKKKRELLENIEDEKAVYQEVRALSQQVRMEDGAIRVYVGPDRFVEYGAPPDPLLSQPIRLVCSITYEDLVLVYCCECTSDSQYDKMEAYYEKQHLTQRFKRGSLVVEIGGSDRCGNNSLCREILEDVRSGAALEGLLDKIVTGLPRYLLTCLVDGSRDIKIVETKGPRGLDGHSAIFYAVAGEHLYRVERSDDAFRIYRNGSRVLFSGPHSGRQ